MSRIGLWENVLFHALEELDALNLRKRQNPNTSSIENQISEVKSRISEARNHLKIKNLLKN